MQDFAILSDFKGLGVSRSDFFNLPAEAGAGNACDAAGTAARGESAAGISADPESGTRKQSSMDPVFTKAEIQ